MIKYLYLSEDYQVYLSEAPPEDLEDPSFICGVRVRPELNEEESLNLINKIIAVVLERTIDDCYLSNSTPEEMTEEQLINVLKKDREIN